MFLKIPLRLRQLTDAEGDSNLFGNRNLSFGISAVHDFFLRKWNRHSTPGNCHCRTVSRSLIQHDIDIFAGVQCAGLEVCRGTNRDMGNRRIEKLGVGKEIREEKKNLKSLVQSVSKRKDGLNLSGGDAVRFLHEASVENNGRSNVYHAILLIVFCG